jgi:SPP1 family predicted phage head-tail adaptor
MMGAVNFSGMDRRVTIQSYSEANHAGTNQPRKTWSDLITLNARRFQSRTRSNDERFEANQMVAAEVYDFEIRYMATAITHKMRIYDISEARNFYIIGINKLPRMGKIILTAQYRDNG